MRRQQRCSTRKLTHYVQRAEAAATEAMNGVEEAKEEGEVDATAPVLNKVHIRGVNELSTQDIQRYAEEHYSLDLFKKVQWIDDTSANIIYDTEVAAAEALNALSAEQVTEPLQLRQAKTLSTHPNMELQVRQAIEADVKAPGAKDRSRYYLFHPEMDPDNPDNLRYGNRKRRRMDDGYPANKYRRRDYQDDLFHRRASVDKGNFHEDMYGDDPQGDVRRSSYSSGSEYGRRKVKYDEDLIAKKEDGRLRNRSASPGRDGDGRFGFREDQPRRPTARARSPIRQEVRRGSDNRGVRDNLRKELFPDRKGSSALTNGHMNGAPKELFASRPSSSASTKELFPDRFNGSAHRRREAKDIHPDEVADAIGKYNLDGAAERITHSSSGRRPDRSERKPNGAGRDLFARINGGPQVESSYGRLQDRPKDAGFSIKGAGRVDESPGLSILGASREQAENPLVKELFPMKAGGGKGGKDLFDGRIKGRGAQRRRAEDLF